MASDIVGQGTAADPWVLKTPARMSGNENSVCSKRTNEAYVRRR